MRRCFLILSAISFSGWSQPSQTFAMPVQHTRDFVDYAAAFAPTAAVLVALIIGAIQLILQWQQAKQDRFELQYKVYVAAQEALSRALQTRGNLDSKALAVFSAATAHAEFLFGPDVLKALREITLKTCDAANAYTRIIDYMSEGCKETDAVKGKLAHQDFLAAQDELRTIDDWTRRQLISLNALMRPYLQLHHDRSFPARLCARIRRWVDEDQPAKLATRHEA